MRYALLVAIEAVIDEALKLTVKERAEVIARLLDTLDEDAQDDVTHHAAWTEAIDRRLADVRQGRVSVIDAATAVARARAAATRRR